MKMELSSDFTQYYLNTTKPIIEKCAEIYPLMNKIEKEGLVLPDDHPDIVKIASYKDSAGAWFVGIMMCRIEDALKFGYGFDLINSLNQILGTLKEGSTYWTNVWNNDVSSEEAKNLKECWKVVDQLTSKLPQN